MRGLVLAVVAGVLFPVPAAAAETGAINGVIHNETTGEPQEGVPVTLLHLRPGEQNPEEMKIVTDERGRYAFDDLDTGAEHVYALDARHQGGLFAGGTMVIPSDTKDEPVLETDLLVWDTTDDPGSILLRRNDMFLVPQDNSVAVIDSYRVLNTSERAYIGRGGAGASTTLGFPLPDGAQRGGVGIVNEPRIDIPELRATEFGFGITVAIPPGRTDVTFSYRIDGSGGSYDLTRTALYPILDSSVFAQDPLEVRSNRLEERGPETVGGDDYVEYAASDVVDPGDPIQILAVAEAGMSPWLIAGAAAALGLVAIAVAGGIVLRRTTTPRVGPESKPQPAARDDVVIAIAELDLSYRSGEIDVDEWRAQREELKARVEERAPEPTP